MCRLLADLAWALVLLTRLPVACRDGRNAADALAASVWAYPIVGGGVGALGGVAYGLLFAIGLSPALCAILALALMIAATGAFHEDGLADTADGFGGGATRERKLAIMRDHCIGAYGVVSITIALVLRTTAIMNIHNPLHVLGALTATGALSRSGMVGLMWALPAARQDGLAAQIRQPGAGVVRVALAIGLLLTFLLLPFWSALISIVLVGSACITIGWLARRQIGGITGDVLGAAQQIAECASLVALSNSLM